MFDQFFWAEKVEWLGVGSAPLSTATLFPMPAHGDITAGGTSDGHGSTDDATDDLFPAGHRAEVLEECAQRAAQCFAVAMSASVVSQCGALAAELAGERDGRRVACEVGRNGD